MEMLPGTGELDTLAESPLPLPGTTVMFDKTK
jgi:hypothetical protein